jgi:sugar/nucleoside kinase (ribokinase family)
VRSLGIVGNLSRDIVDGGAPRIGGGAFYAAQALRLLGRPATIVTKCAADDRETLLRPLVALGIPVEWRPGRSTATFVISYDGERRNMNVDAIGDTWTLQDAQTWAAQALQEARWIHVASLVRSDFSADALAALADGRRLSLDGQGIVRASRTGPLQLDRDFDPDLLRHVSVLKLAEEEAEALVGGIDERALAEIGVPEVVVTFGSRGSLVVAGGRAERVPAYPLPQDPTGAGDVFAAGYLAGRSAGLAPAAAARRATALVATLLRAN